jgi:hypothetical protein
MAGAGVLPGRAAAEAARQGWRVVAFAFDEAPGLLEHAEAVIPSGIHDIRPVLAELRARRIEATLFVGKFAKQRVLDAAQTDGGDAAARALAGRGLSDAALAEMVVATLSGMGVEVLDQRRFLGPWIVGPGVLTAGQPSPEQWAEIREGARLARRLAADGIGQTVVRFRGVTVAVEAAEGTDEAIRRGTRLAGPGAVVVKAVAPAHDYRFDVPTVGAATLEAMAHGRAAALALDSGKMLLVDREHVVRRAEAAGIVVVSVGDDT